MPRLNEEKNQLGFKPEDLDQVDAFVHGSKLQLNDHVIEAYHAFLTAMPEGAATLSKDGIILHCNPKLMQLLGIPSSEIIGMPFHEWLGPEDRERFTKLLNDREIMVGDLNLKRFGNGMVPVQISANRLDIDGLNLISLVVVDLSDRHHLELERHKFVSLAENSHDFIAMCDEDQLFNYINPHGLRMLGLESLERARTTPFWKLFFPEDQEFIQYELFVRVRQQNVEEAEFRLRHCQNGGPLWVSIDLFTIQDIQNEPIGFACIIRDITARKFIEDRLRLTSKVFENSLESVIITDAERNIIEVNKAFTRMTGYERNEVLGKNPRLLKSGEHDDKFYVEMWRSINEYGYWSGEIYNRRKSGEISIEWMSLSVVRNEDGKVAYYVSLANDITAYKHHQKQLEHMAHYDILTDIPNRVLLTDRLAQAVAQSQRDNKLLAVCYLDLDGFKPINDELGHDVGDQILITTTNRIQQAIRSTDTVARIGGDEFVVLLLDLEKQEECSLSLHRLMDAISKPISIGMHDFTITASIGVSLFPDDDVSQDCLLRHADQAMYTAKQMGRNRYFFYDVEQDQKIKSRFENKQRLQQAFLNNEFVLHFQPKVELSSLRPNGAEALIRWQHPEQGLLYPGQFMQMIESADLETELGELVIEHALRQMVAWHAEGLSMEISINIAAKHLQSNHFILNLQKALNRHPTLPRGLLQIEVLETAALEDIHRVRQIIESCKAIGVSFALDDFGTGYSTLAYLRNLPADTLKIDQTFVRDMLMDSGDLAIVQGIIALAKTFKRITVAEGVETEMHIDLLRSMGCEYGQGYGIAKPMPAEMFSAWFSTWASRPRK